MNVESGTLEMVNIDQLLMDDAFNCRGIISAVDVADLAKSIETKGLIQPVVVQPCSQEEMSENPDKKYKLLAGYRRTTAHKVLGRSKIQAIIKPYMSDTEALVFNLSENLDREDLTILQEARAIKKLKDLGVTRQDAADRLSKSVGWIQIRFYLLDLPEEIQLEVEAGFITQTQIRELYTVLSRDGVEGCYEAARSLKEAKVQGKKNQSLNLNKNNPNSKKLKTRSEIVDMTIHICETVGPGMHTRCLAWASGEISSNDLFVDLRAECDNKGKLYSPMEMASKTNQYAASDAD